MTINIDPDWCIAAAHREGDQEIGAGFETIPYISRDYYWKRNGLRWEVWVARGGVHSRVGTFSFWRWRTAARICNEIFAAYHEGRDAERGRHSR